MVLNGQVECPDFQRVLRWSPLMAFNLMNGFDGGMFIPPVILARTGSGEKIKNILIDGQQRLTAVTLMYLGYWPKGYTKSNFDWQFNKLQKLYLDCSDIEELKTKLRDDPEYEAIEGLGTNRSKGTTATFKRNYKKLLLDREAYKKALFENSYLGFSYVKFSKDSPEKEKELCAKTFAQINTTGVDLQYKETRKALYTLVTNEEQLKFMKTELYDKEIKHSYRYDFMRLCSLAYELKIIRTLSKKSVLDTFSYEYKDGDDKNPQQYQLAENLTNDDAREQYIVDYMINAVSGGYNFNNERYVDDIELLSADDKKKLLPYRPEYARRLEATRPLFNAILSKVGEVATMSFAGFDTVAFGYVFWCIFVGKTPNKAKLDSLSGELKEYIESHQGDKSSNSPANLRERLKNSVGLYKGCFDDK